MSQPAIREILLAQPESVPASPPGEDGTGQELNDDARLLAGRAGVLAGLLDSHLKAYPELLARRQREGDSEEVRAEAHQLAEEAATFLQTMAHRRDLVVVSARTNDPEMNMTYALALLEQLYFSFCLLSGPDDYMVRIALEADDPARLVELLDVRPWLAHHGIENPDY
jgi:hypothetical protein